MLAKHCLWWFTVVWRAIQSGQAEKLKAKKKAMELGPHLAGVGNCPILGILDITL